jgi:hypothetical protein
MTHESAAHEALARFDRLPTADARLLEALAVHQWFDATVVAYTAASLGTGPALERIAASPFVVKERVPRFGPADEPRYGVRAVLRTALYTRLRTERPAAYRQAHAIAASYYHQPLEPLRADRLTWYVHEVRHLAAVRPQSATERLAAFAHNALVAGYTEAAGRAATELAAASAAPADQSLAGIVEAVAKILDAPAHVDHGTVVALDDLLARHETPSDPTAARLVMLARDLVVHYTERPAPVSPLTAMVVPAVTAAVDPRGMPVLGGELLLLEDMAHPSRAITTRTHRVELLSTGKSVHRITTTLNTGERNGRNMVLADLLPGNRWGRLDRLQLSERGTRPLSVLRESEAVRTVAQGVGRLLDTGEAPAGGSTRAELSRRLGSLGWRSGTDELSALLSRTRQADDVDRLLRDRVAGLMRFTPVIALLDVYPGLPSEVSYDYQGDCVTHRFGLGQVVTSLALVLPLEVRNRLEFVAPDDLVLGDVRTTSGVRLVPLPDEGDDGAVRRYDIEHERGEQDENGARITVDLGFRLPDHEFRNAVQTSVLSMVLSLGALLLWVADTSFLPVIGTVIASVVALLDGSRDGAPYGGNEPLHVFAGKPLRFVRRSNSVAAIAAAAAPNAGSLFGSLCASGVAFLYCLATCVFVATAQQAARRALPGGPLPSGRP